MNIDKLMKVAKEFEKKAEEREEEELSEIMGGQSPHAPYDDDPPIDEKKKFVPSSHPMMQLKERDIPANYDDLKKVHEFLDGPGKRAIWSAIFKAEEEQGKDSEEAEQLYDAFQDASGIILRLVSDYTPFM
jgi:hypothetical protein